MWSPTAKAVAPPTLAAEPAEANPPSLKLRRVTHLIRIHPRVNPWLSAKAGKFLTVHNKTKREEGLTIGKEKPVVAKIAPNVSHAFKNIGDHIIYLISYSNMEFDPSNPDVFENKILD